MSSLFRGRRRAAITCLFLALPILIGATCQPVKKTPQVQPAPPGVNPCPTAAAVGLDPFTQDELNNNWAPDRQAPSGGVTSVSFGGCADVAEIGIDSALVHPTMNFNRTEGILTVPPGNFGNAVQVNLYLDPAWQDNATRAGLWVVGDNNAGARDNLFGIIEFANIEASTSGSPGLTDTHEGFRFWTSVPGAWTNSNVAFTYGEWVTLRIELDTTAQEYNYFVDGVLVGTVAGGANFIREVFINQFNFGAHGFANLSTDNYTGHWFAGV